jgi:DNA-binding transcriptional regulator YhcF (GntR family)
LIANMLGVRREGVTEAAGHLQKLGIIQYKRGRITVVDRPKLEEMCCECYAVVKAETDRLLPYGISAIPALSARAGQAPGTPGLPSAAAGPRD